MRVLCAALCLLATVLATAATPARLRFLTAESRAPPRAPPIEPFSQHLHGATESGRIFGGDDAKLKQFPHQAALFDAVKKFFCSATVISKSWVLTAGHCIDWTRSDIEVRAGFVSLASPGKNMQSVTTTLADRKIHAHFDMDYLDNDIAVIKLTQALTINYQYVSPAVLPTYKEASEDLAAETVTITGWGRIGDGNTPATNDQLKYASIIISPNKICEDVFGNAVIGTKLCAETSGTSTCTGDSGGPIVYQKPSFAEWNLVGIVSFGSSAGCAQGKPVVFTRVSSFLDFIEDNTDININDNPEDDSEE